MIPVTKPFLPDINKYNAYVASIFERNWLTNNGPLLNEFELKIKDYLDVDHFVYLNNGTIALQIALKVLDVKGDVITTPFSYVATTSSIVWENCNPIFVDIDKGSYNIDPTKIEKSITPETTAILATHVYGNPCDIDAIEKIAKKHNLKVIYDAAHCFGTKYKGRSVFEYGDISTTSFHATKLMHTIEGGGIFTKDPEIVRKVSLARNFGHDGEFKYDGVGINGKNSEFHSAMGLVNLEYVNDILSKRKKDTMQYDAWFEQLNYHKQDISSFASFNYSYYPFLLPTKAMCDKIYETLKAHRIYARRYFFPTLDKLPYVKTKNDLKVANDISNRIICLPLYYDLRKEEIDMVSRIILRTLKN